MIRKSPLRPPGLPGSLALLLALSLAVLACGEGEKGGKSSPGRPGAAPRDSTTGPGGPGPSPAVPVPDHPDSGSGTELPTEVPADPAGDVPTAPDIADPAGDIVAIRELVLESGPEAVRERARTELPAAVSALAAAAGRSEAAKLLLDPVFPPSRAPTAEETAALDRAWEDLECRREGAAAAELEALPADLGEACLLRAMLAPDARAFGEWVGRTLALGAADDLRDLAAGVMLAEAGALVAAETALSRTKDPRARAALVLLALTRGDDVESAWTAAEGGAAAAPEDRDLQVVRAGLALARGDVEGSGALLEPLLETAAEDPRVWEVAGALRSVRRDLEGALVAFEKLRALDPGAASAYRHAARLLLAKGEPKEAVRILEEGDAVADRARPERLWSALAAVLDSRGAEGADRSLAAAFLDAALQQVSRDGETAEAEGLLARSVRIDPTLAPAWVALSEVRLKRGDLPGAIATLEEGAKPISTDDERWWLLLRLAVRLLESGDADGYREYAAGLPDGSTAGRLLGGLGAPSENGPVLVPDWSRCRIGPGEARFAALAAAFLGDAEGVSSRLTLREAMTKAGAVAVSGSTFDPRPLIRQGRILVLERIVTGERVPLPQMVLLVGFDEGLDAYFSDDPSPWGAALVPASEVAGGILYCLPDEAGVPAADGEASRLAKVLTLRDRMEFAEAAKSVPEHAESVLGVFLRTWAALLQKDAAAAAKILDAALAKDPQSEVIRLLLAETHLLTGEVGRAVQAVQGLDHLTGSLLIRRVKGLELLGQGKEEEGLDVLRKILAERPGYLQIYTDLSDHLLPQGKFKEGIRILHELGAREPRVRDEVVYQAVLNQAYTGLIRTAVTGEDLMLLVTSPYAEVRRAAVRAATRLSYTEALKLLPRLAEDPEPTVRALTVRFLGEKGYRDAAGTVRERCRDDDARVRGAAARAVRQLLGLEGAPLLVSLLRDGDSYVRDVAHAELVSLSGKEFGFEPDGPEAERDEAVRRWEAWAESR